MVKIFNIDKPLSLSQQREKYGFGGNGFLYRSSWIFHTNLADVVSRPRAYEVDFTGDFSEMSYNEQVESLNKDDFVLDTALLSQILFEHYSETGQRMAELWWSRTSWMYLNNHILVKFTPWGLYIHDDYQGLNLDNIKSKRVNLILARKIK